MLRPGIPIPGVANLLLKVESNINSGIPVGEPPGVNMNEWYTFKFVVPLKNTRF
jgi:hypothetical protein